MHLVWLDSFQPVTVSQLAVLMRASLTLLMLDADWWCIGLLVQERDPRSYQIFLQLPSGATFLGSTPEQLYMRSGQAVASEAVAATRPRGPAGPALPSSPPPPPPPPFPLPAYPTSPYAASVYLSSQALLLFAPLVDLAHRLHQLHVQH